MIVVVGGLSQSARSRVGRVAALVRARREDLRDFVLLSTFKNRSIIRSICAAFSYRKHALGQQASRPGWRKLKGMRRLGVGLLRRGSPPPLLARRSFASSGPVVVGRDLLRAAPKAAPSSSARQQPSAAGEAAPAQSAAAGALFDELDEVPATAAPLRTQAAADGSAAAADAAGQGLVGRVLQEDGRQRGAPPEDEPEWSLALSSADRVAALEQIREELDFDALFDEDVEEVARLTAHELAELEKTRFVQAAGDHTPDWGIPGKPRRPPARPRYTLASVQSEAHLRRAWSPRQAPATPRRSAFTPGAATMSTLSRTCTTPTAGWRRCRHDRCVLLSVLTD